MTTRYCHFDSGISIKRQGFVSTLKWVLTRRYGFHNAVANKAINAFRRGEFFCRDNGNGVRVRVDPDRTQKCCWIEVASNEILLDVMKY